MTERTLSEVAAWHDEEAASLQDTLDASTAEDHEHYGSELAAMQKAAALHRSYAASVREMMEENGRLREALSDIAEERDYEWLDRENMLEQVLMGHVTTARAALSGSAPKSEETQDDGR